MNPINDYFLTTSRDKTSRLWDLLNKKCICIFQDSLHATFDNTGKVIASVTASLNKSNNKVINFINLYSVEGVLNGPFKVFQIEEVSKITQLKFSNDGLYIVCVTNENVILVVDAYEYVVVKTLKGDINESDISLQIDISADSKYVVSGSENGNILIWNIETGELINEMECHPQTAFCVKFSPIHSLLATACTNLVLWHPAIIEQY